MNPPLLEGTFTVVMRKYRCHSISGILCTALANPAQQKWAQIGVGAEESYWDGRGNGEAAERKTNHHGYALFRMNL